MARPESWTTATVEELSADEAGSLTDGPFGSNLKTSHYTESGPRVIRLQNIGDGAFIDEKAHISEDHFERLRKHEATAGDVVVAMLGENLPRACLVPEPVGPAIVKADCVRLRVHPRLTTPSYVMHALNSHQVRTQASELMHGIGRPRLGLKWFRTLDLPLAPFPEQHRIVEAIESYFTRLDDAVATLERVQRNLKRYRASVLKAAVEGRLVPTEAELARAEGRDYEPASVLLDRILAERRRRWEEAELAKMNAKGKTPKDDHWKRKYKEPETSDSDRLPLLPDGWVWITLDALILDIQAGKNFRCEERPPGPSEVGVVKVSSVSWGHFQEEESKTCTRAMHVRPELFIREGDFLISRANTIELVGACVIAGRATKTLMLSDKILRLSILSTWKWWLLWVLRSTWGRGEIQKLATGNQESMRNISQASLRRIRVPLPPAAESQRILEVVDELHAVADRTESVSQTNLVRSDRLRQSILKWAFEGRLVDQDPSDEPAGVLLERIQAERADTGDEKSRSRGRQSGKRRLAGRRRSG